MSAKPLKASEQIAASLPASKSPKALRRRKPGLLHNSRGVEIQDVNTKMHKVCYECASVPAVRRLVVTTGGGRYAKTDVYCIGCGGQLMAKLTEEYQRACSFLRLGYVSPGAVDEGIRL